MNPRFPLTAKLLIWFSLNLVLLMLLTWLTLRFVTATGINSFLAGHVGGRVELTARTLIKELEAQPREEWNATIARYEQAQPAPVRFLVLDHGHEVLAGEMVELPKLVTDQLPARRTERGSSEETAGLGARKETPALSPGASALPPHLRGSGPSAGGPREGGWVEVPGSRRPGDGPALTHHRFLVQTEEPRTYWVGLFMAIHSEQRPEPKPIIFLARANTFSAGGFFFNYRPWILACVGIVVLCGLFWLPFVTGITRTITQMTRATRQIADGQFDVRVDETRTDELGQLGAAINRMSTRLSGFVSGQKRSLGDIAHELCSPLARLQMAVGILEQNSTTDQKEWLDDVREEVQHMSNLVNELLTISKASLKPGNVKRTAVNVRATVEAAVKREAADHGEVVVDVPGEFECFASPELLQRALANVVRNALRYAASFGPITITARREHESIIIIITDLGPGVPPQHLDRIFDAFYRLEPDRARDTGGAGLGLAIVKTCIEGCGGTVSAKNREPRGLEVRVTLPAK